MKFLTVDDSTTMRLIIKNAILNNFKDVEVYEAKDGQEALDVLAQHPDINVVFMDWNMPVMDGREATIKIRENPAYKHVKVIMATTEGGKDKVKEMISYGVKGYLVKPLKPTSVVPVVQKMIDLVKQEREKEKENV
ncbi:MAG: response regulator [Epsilonproteobacteria bacterium]|nr:response regulator [Campylobacterota bacterium]